MIDGRRFFAAPIEFYAQGQTLRVCLWCDGVSKEGAGVPLCACETKPRVWIRVCAIDANKLASGPEGDDDAY